LESKQFCPKPKDLQITGLES